MEAEAEHLGREIECNFSRAYFETGRQRDRCLGRWIGVLQGLVRECSRFYDHSLRDPVEVYVTAREVLLELVAALAPR